MKRPMKRSKPDRAPPLSTARMRQTAHWNEDALSDAQRQAEALAAQRALRRRRRRVVLVVLLSLALIVGMPIVQRWLTH